MKTLYRVAFIVSVIWLVLGTVITFATPMDESVARRLSRNPQAWELKITDQNTDEIYPTDEKVLKDMLLRFIEKNPSPSNQKREHADTLVLLVTLLALVGWLRERYIEKKMKPNQALQTTIMAVTDAAAQPPRQP